MGLNLGFQQFSIANFAQAFQLNVTNADGTNIPPQGAFLSACCFSSLLVSS